MLEYVPRRYALLSRSIRERQEVAAVVENGVLQRLFDVRRKFLEMMVVACVVNRGG